MKALLALALTAAVLVAPRPAAAQNTDLEKRLANAKRLDCRFTVVATGSWAQGTPRAAAKPATLDVVFFHIDIDGGTAVADGNFGKSFIVVRYSHGYLHLLQMSQAGPLRVTTVIADETSAGRMKAVQSRHEYSSIALPGFTSKPEMYVGDCAVADSEGNDAKASGGAPSR